MASGRELFQRFLHRYQVAQRLAHLVAAQPQQAVVHPVAGEGDDARGRLALGDFVLVMGEDQVLPASVNVQALAQVGHGHTGAFNVPAGTARPPRAFPRRLAGAGALPQGEVHGVFLVLVYLDATARLHPLQGAVAQFAVALAALHPEEDVAARGVGVAGVHQPADGLDDGADFLCGAGVDVGAANVQGVHGREEVVNELLGQFGGFDALLLGPLDYLVVHVGKVLDVVHLKTEMFQIPAQHVEGDVAEGVADVGGRVRGDATDVHLDGVAVGGGELGGFAG